MYKMYNTTPAIGMCTNLLAVPSIVSQIISIAVLSGGKLNLKDNKKVPTSSFTVIFYGDSFVPSPSVVSLRSCTVTVKFFYEML